MREVVREMGDERAVGFLRKFYGWYLRGTEGARALRGELMPCQTRARPPSTMLLDACPEARALLVAHAGRDRPAARHRQSDRLLDLPISIYGGG